MITAKQVIQRVSTQGGELTILDDISLHINAGESLAIVGASGSGKSTLLGLLAGLDVPTQGEILLHDQPLSSLDEEARAAKRAEYVGFVFQSFQLLPAFTALENVLLPLELQGVKQAETLAKQCLERVGLSHRLTHYPRQLSGGEQQRVAIARAFAGRPKVLFADEPTGNLDAATGAEIIECLFGLNAEEGTTLVMVTHEQRLADRCDRAICLEAGRILSETPSAAESSTATGEVPA